VGLCIPVVLLGAFDFELPESAIALRPASPRDSARLLCVDPFAVPPLSEAAIRDLPRFLRPGDVMVFNDTKVLPVELSVLRLAREGGGQPIPISLTLFERMADGAWRAFARPSKRLREGDHLFAGGLTCPSLVVSGKEDDGVLVLQGVDILPIEELIRNFGAIPLPPYISKARQSDQRDFADYQTVYAQAEGAVAAPTAGLHFTPELLETLQAAGVKRVFATLHVGPGTFLPVKAESIEDHTIHEEWCEITDEAANTINEAKRRGGRLIAVGTTSLRLLETAAAGAAKIHPYSGRTKLFITPGYRFLTADMLLTNFHLPKSTLFMLVCAFSGMQLMKDAYAHALASGFRFYSYGDACLLHRGAQ